MSFLGVILGKTPSSFIHSACRFADQKRKNHHTSHKGFPGGQIHGFPEGTWGARVCARQKPRQFDSVLVVLILWLKAFSLSQCAEAQHRGLVLFMLSV